LVWDCVAIPHTASATERPIHAEGAGLHRDAELPGLESMAMMEKVPDVSAATGTVGRAMTVVAIKIPRASGLDLPSGSKPRNRPSRLTEDRFQGSGKSLASP
jgi:hypothetical protein